VVLTVLGILIALTVPTVQRVRNAGFKAADASNLRQIGVAMNLYVGENNGFYPTMISGAGSGWEGPFWPDQLEPYLERREDGAHGRARVFYNPKFRENHHIAGYGANSYVVNLHEQDPVTGMPRKISCLQIDNEAKTILVANSFLPSQESEGELLATWFIKGGTATTQPEGTSSPRPYPVHPGDTFVALFCDGHVVDVKWDYYLENSKELFGPPPWLP